MDLTWTDPKTHVLQREPFTGDIDQVRAKAMQMLAVYASEAPDEYPGLALEIAYDDPESLAIGVTPHGWCLIRSDDEAASWRTMGDEAAEDIYTVTWSVPDDLPASWLLPPDIALGAIAHWLNGHEMDPTLTWISNEL